MRTLRALKRQGDGARRKETRMRSGSPVVGGEGEGSRIRKILLTFTEFVVEIHGDGAERSAHLSGFKCKSVAAASGSLKLLLLLLLLFINLFIF